MSDNNQTANASVLTGRVVSDKMDKSITVLIERLVRHPLYGKEMRLTSKCYAHDENKQAKLGDAVRIMETRPLSKLKRWRLAEVLERPAKMREQAQKL